MIRGRISALLLPAAWSQRVLLASRRPRRRRGTSHIDQSAFNQFVESNCLDCHDNTAGTAGLALDDLIATDIGQNQQAWEKVVRKLTARQMPPSDMPRPKEEGI